MQLVRRLFSGDGVSLQQTPGKSLLVRRPSARTGFTLLEMLIAVGIMSALTALFLVGIQKVRERAKIQYCQNNLRELGMAFNHYAQLYGSWLPPTSDDSKDNLRPLYPYCIDTFEVFICIATGNRVDVEADLEDNAEGGRTGSKGHSYDYWNYYLFDNDKTALATPEAKNRSNVDVRGEIIWILSDAVESGTPRKLDESDNHYETGGNVLYGDSHVEWVPTGLWDLKFQIGNSKR